MRLYADGVEIGSGQADSSGGFSVSQTRALSQGSHVITATATDGAGNVSAMSAPLTIVADTATPTMTIVSGNATLVGTATTTLTFTFSEAPAGFAASDVTVTGGTISNFAVTADPKVYTATLTPTASVASSITVSVAGASYTDLAGNSGDAGMASIAFDPGSSGSVVDGYIANAVVFRDNNNNNVWDHEAFVDSNNNGLRDAGENFTDTNNDGLFTAESFVLTDAQGNFANLTGTGRIVLTPLIAGNGTVLTTDISTGQTYTKQLTAPEGSTVVTPLTTLIEALLPANATPAQVAATSAQVSAALGLDASVDLTRYDPIVAASTAGGDANAQSIAVEVQKAAVQVANILGVVGDAAAAAGAGNGSDAVRSAATSLGTQITNAAAAGTTVNLSNSATVATVLNDVAAATTDPTAAAKLTTQAASTATALSAVNEAVSQVDSTTGSASSALSQVVAAQIVAQTNLSNAVTAAITSNTTVDSTNFTDAALAAAVDQAGTQVQVVIPVAPPANLTLGTPDRPRARRSDGLRASMAPSSMPASGFSIGLGATPGVVAGDKLTLILDGVTVGTATLTSGDITANSVGFTLGPHDLRRGRRQDDHGAFHQGGRQHIGRGFAPRPDPGRYHRADAGRRHDLGWRDQRGRGDCRCRNPAFTDRDRFGGDDHGQRQRVAQRDDRGQDRQ